MKDSPSPCPPIPFTDIGPVEWTPADEARLDKALAEHYGTPPRPLAGPVFEYTLKK